ncbi:MAG: sugar ABC transporter substrate-binding protein [Nitrososphaerales archaeon]
MSKEPIKLDRRKFVYAGLGAVAIAAIGIAAYFATRPPEKIVETVVQTQVQTQVQTVEKPIERVVTQTIERPVEKTIVTTVAGTPTTIVQTEVKRETVVQTQTVEVPAKREFEGETIRVAFIGGGAYETTYERIPIFERLTGAKVDVAFKVSHFELNKKYDLMFASGKVEFDVISNHTSFYAKWVDFLEPLDSYLKDEDRKDFFEPLLGAGVVEGKLYIIPRGQSDSRLVYYRTDLFNDPKEKEAFEKKFGYELKPPENWEQWRDIAIHFTRPPDLYGFVFTGKEEALTGTIYEATLSAGGQFFDENWGVRLNEEPGVLALTHYANLYNKWKVTPAGVPTYLWDEVNSLFRSGAIAFLFDWPGWYQLVKQSKVGDKFDMALYPVGPAGKRAVWSGSHGFCMTKAAKNKKAAWALIEFLTSHDNMYHESSTTGSNPTRKSVFKRILGDAALSPDPRDLKRLKLLLEIADKYYVPVPKTGKWLEISDIYWPEAQKAIVGEKSPKEALDAIAEKVKKLKLP